MTPNVSQLWDKIAELESETRFERNAYPKGMCPFPFRLRGQGFFPGGDGLWRDDSEVTAVRAGTLPENGVLFLGNDFGTLSSYESLRSRSYENPWTWRNVKRRVIEAGIPVDKTFFTNATLGLRTEGKRFLKETGRRC
jgi:hypothetical protein